MINDVKLAPLSRKEESPAIDLITIVIWMAIGLVVIITPLVMVSLG